MIRVILALYLLLFSATVSAWSEADHVDAWCTHGEVEHILPDKARVDCLTDTHAIEADYAKKWAEAIGQSLYYASQTGLKPGILLIVGPNDWRYVARLTEAISEGGLRIRLWFTPKVE